jgi:23S rRNA (cytidine1920-2'-O)/16S rRNA (cytidine1409-2'-O)-methyltransferase
VTSRERAQSLILSGCVRLGDEVVDKPGRMFAEDTPLTVLEDPNPFVGRGGLKLEHALETFGIEAAGKVALDVGASTGGFTDCLLQRGAAKVYAVDVGYGQLDWKLQSDDRVVMVDRTNARYLSPSHVNEESIDLAVIDVSFISLRLILPKVMDLVQPEGELVALVKPQFEVGKEEVEHKGIITDPEKHRNVLLGLHAFVQELGWVVRAWTPSPVKGQKGNREYLIHCVPAGRWDAVTVDSVEALVKI